MRRTGDFARVQSTGRRQRGRHLVLVVATGATDRPRVGLTVSRKVGNAVVRNRVKRWLRENVRALAPEFPVGHDFVLIAQPSASTAGLLGLRDEIASLLGRPRR